MFGTVSYTHLDVYKRQMVAILYSTVSGNFSRGVVVFEGVQAVKIKINIMINIRLSDADLYLIIYPF